MGRATVGSPTTVSRLAPTPSGFLHVGNAVNLVLTSWYVRSRGGLLALRIDDMDAPRVRREYIEDIFGVLEWLGITWDIGPSGVDDFKRNYSLAARTDYYRSELSTAVAAGLPMYACRCSRSDVARRASGDRYGTDPCLGVGLRLSPDETAGKVLLPLARPGPSGMVTSADDALTEVVVWRREGSPAYHWASIIEDRDLGTNAVVRGVDLQPSTAAQIFLAGFVGAEAFSTARFIHHDLVLAPDGSKLSKSTLAGNSSPMDRDHVTRALIRSLAQESGAAWGIRDPTGGLPPDHRSG